VNAKWGTSTLAALGLVAAGTLLAQGSSIDRRVTAVGDGRAELNFPARAETCGDGARFFRYSDDSWYGNWSETSGGFVSSQARNECERGPVRVLVTVVSREIVRIETFVGPLQRANDAVDLGEVSARDASAWLLGLAARLDGRPARDAILPAVLAEGGDPTSGLVAVARDTDRARETRRSAISWLPRVSAGSSQEAQVVRTLSDLARNGDDAPAVRTSAVSALLRVPQGGGIATLTQLAQVGEDPWLGREATRTLARSGDPRARDFLRDVVADTRRSDELRAAAIAGLGGELATGSDARLLRDTYRTLTVEKVKDAVLTSVAGIGGKANADWLMNVARDEREVPALRRKAVTLAERAGASGESLAGLYDAMNDTETRGAVINAMAQEGSRPSRDKLVAIARSTESPQLRRRAVAALERFDSPEVRDVLQSLVMPTRP
jgi:HEAT repeat protein